MNNLPIVSIIIPCRNEEKFIGKCLDSIIANDYLKNDLEILVSDGMSEDKTREIVKRYSKVYPFISLINNVKKIIPAALNMGIQNSKGKIIIRMDAHNIYRKDYISQSVKCLYEYNADNVGGLWIVLPVNNTIIAKSIALSLSNFFGAGNAHYKIGTDAPKYVDTVPFGCYKREVFDKIGFFDEDMIRNEDDEFNHRLIKNGGKILLCPEIVSYYHPRESLLKTWRMYYQYGYFKPLVAKKVGSVLTWRQLMPTIFISSLFITAIFSFLVTKVAWIFFIIIILYVVTNLIVSLNIAIKKCFKCFLFLPIIFTILHFSYGFGYLKGIWDFIVLKRHRRKKIEDVPLTR